MMFRPKVLALAPYCDGTDVGESWCAFQWVNELSKRADVTLLALERPGRTPLGKQLPDVEVITREEPAWVRRHERLNAMAKPAYPIYYYWAKKQIKGLLKSGHEFDVAHQFTPIALRFPSPLKAFQIPYVLGPFGGSLSTPESFNSECATDAWFSRLRQLDRFRLCWDPILKNSYNKASAILGVAPYVNDLLVQSSPSRFEVMSELGVTALKRPPVEKFERSGLRLLHVGRGVRTKGLRDVIRALDKLRDVPGIYLDVAGRGDEIELCEELAKDLDVTHLITFHGQISRAEVDKLYEQADVFCFPSFREPSGSVIFEALSHGLPAVVADRGGPGHVVDDTCGFKIQVTNPEVFAEQIAMAVRTLSSMPELRRQLSEGAILKMEELGLWPSKIEALLDLYRSIISNQQPRKEKPCPERQKSSLSRPVAATGSNC